MKQKIKNIFFALLIFETVLSFANLAYAQTVTNGYDYNYAKDAGVSAQIEKFLCAPSGGQTSTNTGTFYPDSANANNDLFTCINKLYRFAIAAGSVVGIFFIVIAGYLYMSSEGSQETVDRAKSIFASSITAMVILFAGFILLKALNPDLLRFQSIQPPKINLPDSQTGSGTGNKTAVGGTCSSSTSNSCAVSIMSACTSWNSSDASVMCNYESGGGKDPAIESGTDVCADGNHFSIGLFQINIISEGGASYMPAACPAGIFQKNGTGTGQGNCLQKNAKGICLKYDCKVINQPAYIACKTELSKPSVNTNIACALYSKRGWQPWQNTYNTCFK